MTGTAGTAGTAMWGAVGRAQLGIPRQGCGCSYGLCMLHLFIIKVLKTTIR